MPEAPASRRITRSGWQRHAALFALLFAAAVSFAGTFQHSLWTPDEPREAEIGREMLASRFSAVPTLGGVPFLEKPPLFVWLMAASYATFGVSEFAARLPAVLCSIGTLLVAFALGRHAGGRTVGLIATILLASMYEFWAVSHRAVNDTALVLFVAAGHLCCLHARAALQAGRRSQALIIAGACAGLAFLTKGAVGPLLLAGPPLLALALLREWRVLRAMAWRLALWGTLFVVLAGGPWILALSRHPGGWEMVRTCLIEQTIGRTLGSEGIGAHAHPFWFYLFNFPRSMAPWILLLPALFASGLLRRQVRARRTVFLALIVVVGALLLSLPSGKRPTYVVPLLPALAVVLADWLARARLDRKLERLTAVTCGRLLAAICALLGLACLGAALGWRPTHDQLAPLMAGHGRPFFALVAVPLLGLAAWSLLPWLHPEASGGTGVAARFVPQVAAALLISHLLLRPLIEPLRDMQPAAQRIAAAIPAGQPLIGVNASETARGVVPFYTGRLLAWVRAGDILETMQQRDACYLIVMGNDAKLVSAEARQSLREVSRFDDPIAFGLVTVYERVP